MKHNKNLEETLKPLFEYLQKEYTNAEGDYKLSGMFSSGAREENVNCIDKIVNKINKLYNTKYALRKEGE